MGETMSHNLTEEMRAKSALNRRIILDEDINRDSVFKVKYFLDKLVKTDLLDPSEKPLPITIVINSPGGYIYEGLALIGKIEALKERGYEIITEVEGIAMSMGFMIALCGSIRKSSRYSRFMFHQPSAGAWGELQNIQDTVEEVNFLWEQMKELVKKYSSITDEQMEDIKARKTDWYLTPQQMKELNAVDIII